MSLFFKKNSLQQKKATVNSFSRRSTHWPITMIFRFKRLEIFRWFFSNIYLIIDVSIENNSTATCYLTEMCTSHRDFRSDPNESDVEIIVSSLLLKTLIYTGAPWNIYDNFLAIHCNTFIHWFEKKSFKNVKISLKQR